MLLTKLPPELIEHILRTLHPLEIVKCRMESANTMP